ncbi:hypothetical protein [Nesterenkonia muleiensis]|uniref:hypothetical protein n=1 Tax=Nesterenkonia muleiensis TaxID=2282648 RepID=UPI0013007528|nr:hypothetical protein [Nesterenkonia muleiensis]
MNQRRRPSPAVYRRRRLVAALLAVVVLALVVWGARALYDTFVDGQGQNESAAQTGAGQDTEDDGAGETEAEPTEEPAEGEDSDDVPDDAAAEGDNSEDELPEGHCAPADIEVRAGTSHEVYDASTAPLLIMEIENVGSEDCTLDVGTAEQQFRVATGGREIFSTAQCDLSGESLELEFEPGQTERAQMLWPRSESAVDCSEPAELTTGDYELTVSVSGISSQPHDFELRGQ